MLFSDKKDMEMKQKNVTTTATDIQIMERGAPLLRRTGCLSENLGGKKWEREEKKSAEMVIFKKT